MELFDESPASRCHSEFISAYGGKSICKGCGKDEELRLGYCFDCASKGEERAAKRTVEQHLEHALEQLKKGNKENARYDIEWALEICAKNRVKKYQQGGVLSVNL